MVERLLISGALDHEAASYCESRLSFISGAGIAIDRIPSDVPSRNRITGM